MIETGSDHFRFDTTGLSDDEAFARYRELYAGGADAVRLGDRVAIRVEAWRLDRMVLYDRMLDGIGHRRDATRVTYNGFTHFTVGLLLAGSMELELADGTGRSVAPGEMIVVDTGQPGGNRFGGAHLATLSIARDVLAATVDDVASLHGCIVPAEPARLYREFVESLLRHLPSMSAAAAKASAGVLTTLLSIALDRSARRRHGEAESRDVDRISRLKRLIDQRLADPDFSATDAVRELELSRSALYRLLAPVGGLATLIRNRRLEALRLRLGDPAEERGIGELVDLVGLPNVSHASRAFSARFGLAPTEYRRISLAGTGNDAFLKMRLWLDEVR